MSLQHHQHEALFQPLELPCGVVLKNRIIKSAMSDSLGDGCGNPTDVQMRLYERWAHGGVAASIVGEVQGSPDFAEKPGNLVLRPDSNRELFGELARRGSANQTQLWLQLGHAGAMAYPPISNPKGPSAINSRGLQCDALTLEEIRDLPALFAQTASTAHGLGFGGVQIHAAHGFLLSQFLSPLFNQRDDEYGGTIQSRMRLLLEVIDEVRNRVSASFVVSLKLNSSDLLEGGFEEEEALDVISALDSTGIDLIDISGGTYFPGAKSASDGTSTGAYFLGFAAQARKRTTKPLMVTGGFKTRKQVQDALMSGLTDMAGLARALVLDPALPDRWRCEDADDPVFPRFVSPPEGAVTAWYTLLMSRHGEDRDLQEAAELESALEQYEDRDSARIAKWKNRFGI